MFRSFTLLGIAAIVGIAAQDPPAKPPAEDYKDRMAKIKETLAEEHYKVGEYLFGVSMHRWARDEFRKSIGFSPDHAEARKRLGYVKKEGDWEPDPDAKLETENKKKGEEEAKLKGEYDKRVARLGSTIAKQWADLGNFCDKNKMKAEAEAAWKLAIEYDPLNNDSRKKLGYVRQGKDGPWLSKFEAEWRKQAKAGIAKAPPGAPQKEETRVEADLGWKHEKRKSPHFLIEVAGHNQEWLTQAVKHGEHCYAMFHKLFNQTEDLFQQPLNIVIVKGKNEHEQYIDKYDQGDAASKAFSKKMGGQFGFPQSEIVQGDRKDLHEPIVHVTAQFLSTHLTGGSRPWVHEGIAFHFGYQIMGTGGTFCTNMAGTGSGGGDRDYSRMEDWPLIIRTLIKEAKDPPMIEVFKCKDFAELSGAEAVKAWSMVDFLVTEHREKFLEFLSKIRGQKEEEDEKTLNEVFGWSLDAFDTRWRVYARASYGG